MENPNNRSQLHLQLVDDGHNNSQQIQNSPSFCPSIDKSIPKAIKCVFAILLLIGFILYRLLYQAFDNSACLSDTYFKATFEVNRWMRNGADNAVIGVGQVIMDAGIILMASIWLVLEKTMRFPGAIGIMFLFRSLFLVIFALRQAIEKLPFDDYIVWHNPGFLSLTVPYDRTRDFFFSGHTSTLTLILLETIVLRYYFLSALFFLCLIFMENMLIISRIHYTIDIMAAIIFSLVIYKMAYKLTKYLDFLLSLPYFAWTTLYQKVKSNEN